MEDTNSGVGAGRRTFLVEHYWPGVTAERFSTAAEGVRARAEELTREGLSIEFLHSTLVPEDEAAFCVLVSESEAAVEEAYRRAGVRFERILDALEIDGTGESRESDGSHPHARRLSQR